MAEVYTGGLLRHEMLYCIDSLAFERASTRGLSVIFDFTTQSELFLITARSFYLFKRSTNKVPLTFRVGASISEPHDFV